MLRLSHITGMLAVALFALAWAAPAQAQATRTWVSGVGDDVNPCSRTAPCKTFAGAISKTAASGEIDCLDPGGFGAVTITKSLALVCDAFTKGGVLVNGTNGVVVSGASINVVLNGLDFEGVGVGLNGVSFQNGASLTVENCEFRDFNTSGTNGYGINFVPSGFAQLYVTNTTIIHNGTGTLTSATGGAIHVKPGSAGSANVVIDRVAMENNANGLVVDTTGSSGTIVLNMSNSSIANSYTGVGVSALSGNGAALLQLYNDVIADNSGDGLGIAGANAIVRVGGSVINGNAKSFEAVLSATVTSYGNNQINENATNTLPTVAGLH